MPTVYTATLMERGQDFRTFVLQCARAFGATIMQRDDPLSDQPKAQAPSDYHTKAIKEAQERLATLQAMTPEQQTAEGLALRQKAVDSVVGYRARGLAENERLDEMASQVRAWHPPTDEHKGLRDFMLAQIRISRNDTAYADRRVHEVQDMTPEAYFVEAVSGAVRDLAYHAKEHEKEVERTSGRNDWIEALYESLPSGDRTP